MQQDVQTIGICRWSYPSDSSGFRSADSDIAATRRKLYAPARMEHRLFLLEHVMLPALRRQTVRDFTLILLMGDRLPAPYRKRVLQLVSDVPQIKPVFAEEGQNQFDLCRRLVADHRRADVAATAQFRLDDDDAVSVRFIEQAHALFALQQPLFEQNGLLGVDFCRGFLFRMHEARCSFTPVSMRFWAPGMMVFIDAQHPRCVLDYHHLQLWHHMPTLTWMNRPMFVRGAHGDNDSGVKKLGRRTRSFPFPEHRLARHMRRRFAIDLPALQTAWAAQRARFLRAA